MTWEEILIENDIIRKVSNYIGFASGEIPNLPKYILDESALKRECYLVKMHKCPLCGSKNITIKKVCKNGGMDGSYYDWNIRCNECRAVNVDYAADEFHGRKFYKTIEDAITAWNEVCEMFLKVKAEERKMNNDSAKM